MSGHAMTAETRLRDALAWVVTASPRAAALMEGAPKLTLDEDGEQIQAKDEFGVRWAVRAQSKGIAMERVSSNGKILLEISMEEHGPVFSARTNRAALRLACDFHDDVYARTRRCSVIPTTNGGPDA